MSAADGVVFTPWPHETMPNWSLPALEAAKCVARQGDELFERVHPRLYEAYFTNSLNIADPGVVADIVAAEGGVDMARFRTDYESGAGREAVVKDYEAAVADGVRSIPTVIAPDTGRALIGMVDAAMYRRVVEEAAG
jgi:predicted DsbA family dithiol-disulfide isomerase